MRILVTIPNCRLTPKGRERRKEIYLVASVRDAGGIQRVQTPIFHRVESDVFLQEDGIEIYCGEPSDFLQVFISVVESDSEIRDIAGHMDEIGGAVGKLPLPPAQLSGIVTSLLAGIFRGNKDDTLYTACLCIPSSKLRTQDVELPSNDRVEKMTVRILELAPLTLPEPEAREK